MPKRQSNFKFCSEKNDGFRPGFGEEGFEKMWVDFMDVGMMFPYTILPLPANSPSRGDQINGTDRKKNGPLQTLPFAEDQVALLQKVQRAARHPPVLWGLLLPD